MTEETEATEQVVVMTEDQAEMVAFLNKLKDAAETACEQACKDVGENESLVHAAVNWADIHCIDAEVYLTAGGQRGLRVLLSEASPSNPQFRQYVADQLRNMDYQDIEVVTEW